jgi:serine/threonine-protein kinase HipA
VTTGYLPPGRTRPIVEGLLPEGYALQQLANEFAKSGLALLALLGPETLGAIVALGAGIPYPPASEGRGSPLSESDIAGRLRGLEPAPLGVSQETNVRLSLGGMQAKLPLARAGDELIDPTFDDPSTVILKPEPSAWPRLAELEAWGLRVLQLSEVRVPDWEVREFEGIRTLVVERFDRVPVEGSRVERVHQEDMCMAVGALPREKYATKPRQRTSLRNLANVLHVNSETPKDDLAAFIRGVVVNLAIGNCDGHARNWALLHGSDGSVRLAPAYDVVPTFHYPSHTRRFAQPISGQAMNPANVRWTHIRDEVESWSIQAALDALEPAVSAVGKALDLVGLPEGSPELEKLVGDFDRLRPT